MMIEKRVTLIIVAAVALLFISVPTVIFNDAMNKYFDFMGQWRVAAVKPSKNAQIPPMRARGRKRTDEPPQPELRFVKFTVKLAGAKTIRLSGSFNKWNPDALALVKTDKKTWTTIVPLPPGAYQYLYTIDGRTILDPMNPETAEFDGRKVSLLTVK